MMTNCLLFRIQMSEQNHYYVEDNYMSIFSSFSVNFPPHFIPSCQLTVSMHQIGSLICNQHNKLMVKMTILFLPYRLIAMQGTHQ